MSLYGVTLVGTCVRPVWVRADSEEIAREKAERGEFTPGGEWTPLHPDRVEAARVFLAVAGGEEQP